MPSSQIPECDLSNTVTKPMLPLCDQPAHHSNAGPATGVDSVEAHGNDADADASTGFSERGSSLRSAGEGYASDSVLTRGLQVPSRSEYVTSGFVYPPILAQCGVSKRHWNQFTHEIMDEARMSRRQWTSTLGKGLGTLAVGGMILGVLSAVPAVVVARKARRHREEQNLIAAAAGLGDSELSRKIQLWNDTFFQPRGIVIRVDLPREESSDMGGMDISPTSSSRRLSRPDSASGPQSSRTSVLTGGSSSGQSGDPHDQAAREEASLRARIVIIRIGSQSTTNSRTGTSRSRDSKYDGPMGSKSN